MNFKQGITWALPLLLSGCITFPTYESEQVQVFWDHPEAIKNCKAKGIVYGSEGHFYDFWLHADRDMIWGALNEMRIKTVELKADTLYLYSPFTFSSSVTLMGKAYDCGRGILPNPMLVNEETPT